MSNFTKSKTVKIVGFFLAVMMLMGVGAAQVHAITLAELIDLFIALEIIPADKAAQARAALTQQEAVPSADVCPYTWARSLTVGATGDDVMKLQKFLNASSDTQLGSSGAGSPGNETSYFGSISKAGVVKFQNKYASEVLAPIGLSAGTGYFGTMTRAKMNELCSTATPVVTPPLGEVTPPGVVPAGTGLTITKAADQPANTLAVRNTARVPFTKIHLTAGSDGPVTVSSLVVERKGLASNNAFSGILLMNEDGTIIGIEKTLNSSNQATIGTDFVIPAGTTKTVIVAANFNDAGSEAGETPSLAVISVNTSATVSGSLPIVGATHTVNNTLTIGSLSSVARGALDPGTNQTKEVGITDYTFSSVKLTAGSAEDITLKSIRWYQSQSASAEDFTNVRTIVDGVDYDVVVDGRYYTTIFPNGGLLIKKGFSKDISVKADIVSGSNRLIDLDIERRTDIHIVGNTFGYGIMPPFGDGTGTDNAEFRTTNNPYYDAAQVTISQGTMNVSSWSTGVPAQNVAVNLNDQPIAGFIIDVKGEPISVGAMLFNFTITEIGSTGDLGMADVTNITLVDENGNVLAGPVDGSEDTANHETITLSDTVTFPVGITRVILKAKLGTDFISNDALAASTTPSGWTTVTGQVTGQSITPAPSSAVSGSIQTVKAGAFAVSVSAQPTARTVIAGAQGFEFARYIFDASQSGEDVRVTAIPLYFDTTGTRTDLTNCKLHDGIGLSAPALNTGSNVKNPSISGTASSTSITFDGTGLIIPKGTSKTLSLRCDVKTGVTATYRWGIDGDVIFTGASGVTSGQEINETFTESYGQIMSASANGSYTVANIGSVLFKAAQAGSTDVVLARYNFTAGPEEDVNLRQIALQLGNTASNTTADLLYQRVTIWNGGTQVGTAQFGLGTGNNLDMATSTSLSPAVTIPKGESVALTIKGDLSAQDVNSSLGAFGGTISVNYDGNNNGLNGNYATGADSGATISGTSGDTSANGTQMYRALLTVEDVTDTTNLTAGSVLYKIKVTAAAGRDILIHQMTFDVVIVGLDIASDWVLTGPSGDLNATGIATSSATTDDSVHGSTGAIGSDGRRLTIVFDPTATDRKVPAGASKIYSLKANTLATLTSGSTETISIRLLADTGIVQGYQVACALDVASEANVMNLGCVNDIVGENGASTTDRFIWSPNSTTTHGVNSAANDATDWTNSYGIPGFPSTGQNFSVRVFNH